MLRARWRDALANSILPYFLAGPENRLPCFVCESESAAFELGNPILLVGPTGSGKTAIALHLAARQAISMGIGDDLGSVVYLPALDFARQYADAASSDDMPPFREAIEKAKVLIVDDLQLIAEKTPAQEELAARIESRFDAQKPTILTSHRMPAEIRSLRPRLVSRVLHGLTMPLSYPAQETRMALLAELALVHDLEIPPSLIERFETGLGKDLSVRSLDSAMKHVALWCRMNNSPVVEAAIDTAIDGLAQGTEVDLSKITQSVARRMGLKTASLRSSSRKQMVVRARSLAMFIARRSTNLSLDQIGKYFGGRDHSTVLHSIRKTEKLLESDVDLHRVFEDVKEKIG